MKTSLFITNLIILVRNTSTPILVKSDIDLPEVLLTYFAFLQFLVMNWLLLSSAWRHRHTRRRRLDRGGQSVLGESRRRESLRQRSVHRDRHRMRCHLDRFPRMLRRHERSPVHALNRKLKGGENLTCIDEIRDYGHDIKTYIAMYRKILTPCFGNAGVHPVQLLKSSVDRGDHFLVTF